MLRWIKYGVGAIVVVGVAGLTLLGANFGSYISTSTNAARRAARNAVPVEFELQRDKQYCKMVQVWMSDKALGIPPEQRRGWPPYDSSVFCEW